jgi:hypothetical protein
MSSVCSRWSLPLLIDIDPSFVRRPSYYDM